jgi:cobalt-zinc-cadmium efflux system membrane fusion protein
MTGKLVWLLGLSALLVAACDRSSSSTNDGHGDRAGVATGDDHTKDEHDGDEHSDEHSEKHEGVDDVVRLSAEAVERAGIVVAPAERRALGGGAAIPAEVQFEPSSTAHVAPLVPGRITRVAVALGDRVRRGQTLGVVASTDVSSARARLEQAQARLSSAEATLKRQQQLSSEGIGAQRAVIEAVAQVDELRAEVEGLRQQLSVFGSGAAGELSLSSPIDGVVVALHGTLGETVTPDEPAFIVTNPTKVAVRGNVPELELARVQQGGAVVVRLHAFPELALAGTITYVAPALDETTRSLPVRVTLKSPDARLRSGLFGSIELASGKDGDAVVVVPVAAVASLDGQNVVFVPTDDVGSFRVRIVTLGRRAGGLFEVRAGLAEGERLATGGAFTLKSALRASEFADDDDH